ncbi:Acyl-CoA thioesterase [Caenorhabditis elegans]|uniref:Acyl-CoA thioesterase n=1 Tax=Caenorhabditis elegans TaxID=6239 RepID=A8WI16_CAEEL|nr:Acyl-CoA thioesterase [Caenorhabditis elegans]CAP19334.1 Acyl-CoA thioesterase [Caenorhabditis elegans]|eukprot:NP_001122945.1 Uncharacterized protein CELE_F49H6.17 [Caenorhabditis elegans]
MTKRAIGPVAELGDAIVAFKTSFCGRYCGGMALFITSADSDGMTPLTSLGFIISAGGAETPMADVRSILSPTVLEFAQ